MRRSAVAITQRQQTTHTHTHTEPQTERQRERPGGHLDGEDGCCNSWQIIRRHRRWRKFRCNNTLATWAIRQPETVRICDTMIHLWYTGRVADVAGSYKRHGAEWLTCRMVNATPGRWRHLATEWMTRLTSCRFVTKPDNWILHVSKLTL